MGIKDEVLDWEEQLKEDLKEIVDAMMKKPDTDEVECIVCGGKTTFGRYKAFTKIANESGRTIGKIEGEINTHAKVKRDLIKITKPRTVHATCGAYESNVTTMLKKYIKELDEAEER